MYDLYVTFGLCPWVTPAHCCLPQYLNSNSNCTSIPLIIDTRLISIYALIKQVNEWEWPMGMALVEFKVW